MRISDWRSDVGSSDLKILEIRLCLAREADDKAGTDRNVRTYFAPVPNPLQHFRFIGRAFHGLQDRGGGMLEWNVQIRCNQPFGHQRNDVIHMRIRIDIVQANPRSEEHTSELQSLMRISYAVFCLKKKTNIKNNENHNTRIK